MGDMRRVEYGTHVIEFRVERRDPATRRV